MPRLTTTAAGFAIAVLVLCSATAASPPAPSIAYVGHGTLYVIGADGNGRRALLRGVADNSFNWSPDGSSIAYTAGVWHADATRVKVARADGSGARVLTKSLPAADEAGAPTWSPDGKRLAFTARDGNGGWAVFLVGADGTGLRRVTPAVGNWENPDWSPDGRWIVLERFWYDTLRSRIVVVHPDGSGLRTIASVITGPQCSCPDWSPDGSKITYQASASAKTAKFPDIYVMASDGTAITQLTHDPARDENPDWSPDGTQIAFYSERPGNAEIYVMNADGSGVRRVTRDPWYAALPRWRPTG